MMVLLSTARGVTTAPAANTIEVFIDDKPVQVDPACTVLQVVMSSEFFFILLLMFHSTGSTGFICKLVAR